MGIWGLPLDIQKHLGRGGGLPPAGHSGNTAPPEPGPNNTWGWACSQCGHANHLLKGRCGGCQEVKSAQALPIAATLR